MTLEESKKLPPEEINRIIAEAIGWTVSAKGWWSEPRREGRGDSSEPPDYFHDLNACHEAEKQVTDPRLYLDTLVCLIGVGDYTVMAPANVRAIALACVLSERKK